ncbi:MAG: TonB family protein [Candidatus Omnitrophota bacterium]
MEPGDKLFKTTFFISLLFHAFVLLPIPDLNSNNQHQDTTPYFRYLNINANQASDLKISQKANMEKQDVSSQRKRIEAKKTPRKTAQRTANKPAKDLTSIKSQNQEIAGETEVLPEQQIITKNEPVNKSLKNDKAYIKYYEIINQKLRESIVYPQYFSEGEVSVSFVVTADGKLMSVDVVNDNSSGNSILRDTAVQIVEKASPFPPFPESLRRIQLTFNVVICFREQS